MRQAAALCRRQEAIDQADGAGRTPSARLHSARSTCGIDGGFWFRRGRRGVEGLWRVTARGEGDLGRCAEFDLRYIDTSSLSFDLQPLARTPLAVIPEPGR